jgi:hypothetical protein
MKSSTVSCLLREPWCRGLYSHRGPSRTATVAALSLALALSGCGQEPPPPDPNADADYHPLVDGAWWRYEHSDWTETVTLEGMMFEGQPAFLMSDSPNPSDQLRSDAVIAKALGRVSRIAKDEYLMSSTGGATLQSSVTYGVGFTRFNEAWADQAAGFVESPEYVRVETPPGGEPLPGEARKHSFEILSLSDEQVTEAGTFDCIQVQRTKDWQAEAAGAEDSDAQTKIFWFARGVGKVRELNVDTGSSESLVEFEIPSTM